MERVLVAGRNRLLVEAIAKLVESYGIWMTAVEVLSGPGAGGDDGENVLLRVDNGGSSSPAPHLRLTSGPRPPRGVTNGTAVLSLDVSPDTLIAALMNMRDGRALNGHANGHPSPPAPRVTSPPGRRPDLTRRERDVVRLLAQGLPGEAISVTLRISTNTLRTHIQNVMGKLGAHSRLEAVAAARQLGLVDDSGPWT